MSFGNQIFHSPSLPVFSVSLFLPLYVYLSPHPPLSVSLSVSLSSCLALSLPLSQAPPLSFPSSFSPHHIPLRFRTSPTLKLREHPDPLSGTMKKRHRRSPLPPPRPPQLDQISFLLSLDPYGNGSKARRKSTSTSTHQGARNALSGLVALAPARPTFSA